MEFITNVKYNNNSLCCYTDKGIYYVPEKGNEYLFHSVSYLQEMIGTLYEIKYGAHTNSYLLTFKRMYDVVGTEKRVMLDDFLYANALLFSNEEELLEYLVGNL